MKIITLCGSTKFKNIFLKINKKLTLQGNIVLMPGFFGHADNEFPDEKVKQKLDELHFRKIDLSNGIYVIDVGGYVGYSTRNEIVYAEKLGKEIIYYSKESGSEGNENN